MEVMGAFVPVMVSPSTRERNSLRQVCLMAAAIDDFSLADPEEYRKAVALAQRTAVLASRRDKVLKGAYSAGDLLQAFIFLWKDEVGLALGYHGPKPAGEHAIPDEIYHLQSPDGRDSDHGDYLPGNFPSLNQRSAAHFADEVLQGAIAPRYP